MGTEKAMGRPIRKSTLTTKAFADTLDDLIDEKKRRDHISQNTIASEIGVASSILSSWSNDTKTPSLDNLTRIAKYFDTSTDYLLGLTKVKKADITIQAASQRYRLSEAALSVLESLDRPQAGILETLLLSPRLPELLSALIACRECLVSIRNEDVLDQIEQPPRTEEEWQEVMRRITFGSQSDRHLLAYLIVHHDTLMERLKLSGKAAADAAVSSLRRVAEELGNDLVAEGRRQADSMESATISRAEFDRVNRLEDAGHIKRPGRRKEATPDGNDNKA